jgi:hypothetical protein
MPDESPQLARLHQSVSDSQTTEGARPLLLISLCLLALVVGIVTGLGAVAFRALIACVHNLLFLGRWSKRHANGTYDVYQEDPGSPWGLRGEHAGVVVECERHAAWPSDCRRRIAHVGGARRFICAGYSAATAG